MEMKTDAWLTLFDETWPKMQGNLSDKPVYELLGAMSGLGKTPFSYDIFVDYQTKSFYQTIDIIRSEASLSDEVSSKAAIKKLFQILLSIWIEAPDHPIVHSFGWWDGITQLLKGYPCDD
jgi:hypothetical protein